MPRKKPTNKSRKATLLKVLAHLGNLGGIECWRSPGEDCAVRIAIRVIQDTPLNRIDQLAEGINGADLFWGKSW